MPPQRKRRRKGDQISTPSELALLGIGSDEEDPDDEDPQALSNLTCKKCRKVFSRGCNLSQHRCRPTPLEPTSADLSSLSPPRCGILREFVRIYGSILLAVVFPTPAFT